MRSTFLKDYNKVIDSLDLLPLEAAMMRARYMTIVRRAEHDSKWNTILYILLINIVTVAGVAITALVSITKVITGVNASTFDTVDSSSALMWFVWVLGVLLVLANKWLFAFDIPKKYIQGDIFLEKLYSEGWLFASSAKRYSGADPREKFVRFSARIEYLSMKLLARARAASAEELAASGTKNPSDIERPGDSARSSLSIIVDD